MVVFLLLRSFASSLVDKENKETAHAWCSLYAFINIPTDNTHDFTEAWFLWFNIKMTEIFIYHSISSKIFSSAHTKFSIIFNQC